MVRRVVTSDGLGNRALAPVMATLLLIAVVVILSSVVAVFVVDIAETTDDVAPSASIRFTHAPGGGATADCGAAAGADRLRIAFTSGQRMRTANLQVRGSSVPDANVDLSNACTGLGDHFSAGEGFSVAIAPEDRIRLVWANGDLSDVVARWPD